MDINKLTKELEEKRIEIGGKKQEISHKQRELAVIASEAKLIEESISKINEQKLKNQNKNNVPKLTDHAVIRYLERLYKIDIEAIKSEILTPSIVKFCDEFESGKFPLDIGGIAIVKNNRIVTIID